MTPLEVLTQNPRFFRICRHDGPVRVPLHLENTRLNEAAFICGGGPQLSETAAALGECRTVTKVAINNAWTVVWPDLYVTSDLLNRTPPGILQTAVVMKFLPTSRRHDAVNRSRQLACEYPNVVFYNRENWCEDAKSPGALCYSNFCDPRRPGIAWIGDTLLTAIDICYKLGYRRMYLFGCGFQMDLAQPYAYPERVDADYVQRNNTHYRRVVASLRDLRHHFWAAGLELFSSTPDSLLNDHFPYVEPHEAIAAEAGRIDPDRDTHGHYQQPWRNVADQRDRGLWRPFVSARHYFADKPLANREAARPARTNGQYDTASAVDHRRTTTNAPTADENHVVQTDGKLWIDGELVAQVTD